MGRNNITAIPGKKFGAPRPNLLGQQPDSKAFRSVNFGTFNGSIAGITKDLASAPIPNAVVMLFRTSDNILIEQKTSDASGNYAFYPTVSGPFYIVAYLDAVTDLSGTTVNTLLPT